MISKSKQFIFIHVPKTGGNSVQSVLLEYSDDEISTNAIHQEGNERFGLKNEWLNTNKHSTLKEYKQILPPDEYTNFFKVSIIRNPWDKLISMYFSPHKNRKTWNRNEFIELIKTMPDIRHYLSTKNGLYDRFFRPRNQITKEIDLLLRFENLSNDFEALCHRLGIPVQKLERKNASTRQSYHNYYDNELIDMVAKKHPVEIALGGYQF